MPLSKRLFDLAACLVLALLLAPLMLGIAVMILLLDGRPVFFVSERMRTPARGFSLLKFRTMRPVAQDGGVSGGEKAHRITRMGHVLRRLRLDELPQLWNVLRGDMSLVGPRPPMRQYVARYPVLYAQVLRSRPGVTGLGTLLTFRLEARLLARSRSAAETDRIYCRACLPRKARLDLIYQARRSLWLDLVILVKTARKVFRPHRLAAWPREVLRALLARSTGQRIARASPGIVRARAPVFAPASPTVQRPRAARGAVPIALARPHAGAARRWDRPPPATGPPSCQKSASCKL